MGMNPIVSKVLDSLKKGGKGLGDGIIKVIIVLAIAFIVAMIMFR
jgi:hypothetical protein